MYSVNFVLITATDLWALRYPATNELWILERPAGGTNTTEAVWTAEPTASTPAPPSWPSTHSVVLASEPMDADPNWRLLGFGELIARRARPEPPDRTPFPDQPSHPLTLAEMTPTAAAAQQPTT